MYDAEKEKTRGRINAERGKQVCPIVAPVHLRGADGIAEAFKVKRDTVKDWWRDGAPIAVVGGAYCAEYNALMAWLCGKTAKIKKPVNSPVPTPCLPSAYPLPVEG